jgi:type II secretory pathway predicted ATPase ExeA
MATPRTQFYHAAREIDGALKGIERCIRRAEGISLVVGPPGTGKSLLLLKVTEQVRDDFDVALLTGASICTRRALWQAVLAAIGEPYRGIDETELRIAIVERIRGLAAAGSGLVILVDEAHTLPTRLIEELRLLTNVPTPMPAVHIVLAGTTRLDEMLGAPRMESLAQRVAVRGHLEPLDHAETLAYLRAQVAAAGLEWDRLFADGCEDAVYKATDGVPRLINQVCDHALVLVAECDRRVTPADVATAWREIQRLPTPTGLEPHQPIDAGGPSPTAAGHPFDDLAGGDIAGGDFGVIEFGGDDPCIEVGDSLAAAPAAERLPPAEDPWGGPDVELVFDGGDPFDAFFDRDGQAGDRYRMEGPEGFGDCRQVASREGRAMGKLLATIGREEQAGRETSGRGGTDCADGLQTDRVGPADDAGVAVAQGDEAGDDQLDVIDDTDMVVIEEDVCEVSDGERSVFSVRPSEYRNLFTRLRRSRG